MLTEFEVRRQVRAIIATASPSMAKVRRLLRLLRPIKLRSKALVHSRAVSSRFADGFTAAHLDRLIQSLRTLYEDVRLEAFRVLRQGERPLATAS